MPVAGWRDKKNHKNERGADMNHTDMNKPENSVNNQGIRGEYVKIKVNVYLGEKLIPHKDMKNLRINCVNVDRIVNDVAARMTGKQSA